MKSIYIILIKLLVLCNLINAKAQIITFPDQNFKAALIALGLDTNNDGNIQKSEIANVKKLDVGNYGITSLVGIKHFTNLENFLFYDNKISTVDLEGMHSLKYIYGIDGATTQLKVKGCVNLEEIIMDNNQLTSLDLTGLTALSDIRASRNNLKRIDLRDKPKLWMVQLFRNEISDFKIGPAPELKHLYLYKNFISEIDLRPFTQLLEADLDGNPLTKVYVTGLSKLEKLNLEPPFNTPSAIKQLNTSGLVSLKEYKW